MESHFYILSCVSNAAEVTRHKNCWSYVFRLTYRWVWPLGSTWVMPGFCTSALPREPFILSVRKTRKFEQIHPSIHAHEPPHFSTPRINLVSPDLSQSTSPSSPPKVWALVKCWVTEWMWQRRHTTTCPPKVTLHLWLRKAQVFVSRNGKTVWRKQEALSIFIPIWKQICLALRKDENWNGANFTWVFDLQQTD